MKNMFLLLAAFAAFSAGAGTTNSPPTRSDPSVESHIIIARPAALLTLTEPKPNEVVKGTVTYSGILVEAAKTRRPLQLVNPAAPQSVYGSPEDNIVRDAVHHKVTGLKLFAIQF